jgi:hypothetical protein
MKEIIIKRDQEKINGLVNYIESLLKMDRQ